MNTTFGNKPSNPSSDQPGNPGPGGSDPSLASAGNGRAASPAIDKVVRSAHEAVDRVAEKAGPALDSLKNRWSSASETLHSQSEEWIRREEQMVESARSCVRDYPLTSVAVAVFAGMLLGRLTSSR